MKILLMPDSFKDSLSASEVTDSMERGIKEAQPDARIFKLAVSDGGEGFLEAVRNFVPEIQTVHTDTLDPIGRHIRAEFLFDHNSSSAYVELAKASGLELLLTSERNPMKTSTYGTGIQIRKAIELGAKKIYAGLGGSSTNDGGTGIASAMGFGFSDRKGELMTMKGRVLRDINEIHTADLHSEVEFYAVNDVQNPLLGHDGAAYTYAHQKGASEADIDLLEVGLRHLADICYEKFGLDFRDYPGSGAAGGTGFGLKTFLNSDFVSGVSFMLELAQFGELVKSEKIDLIITGEGKIDEQTAYGKMVSGIAKEALIHNIPVVAVCGKLDLKKDDLKRLNIEEAKELYDPSKPKEYSFTYASKLISQRTKELIQIIRK